MGGKPYTRTGDIIIAVNPFQWFTELYTEKKRVYYSNRLVWEASGDDPRDGMEPHVYEVSALSYKGLCCKSMRTRRPLFGPVVGGAIASTARDSHTASTFRTCL